MINSCYHAMVAYKQKTKLVSALLLEFAADIFFFFFLKQDRIVLRMNYSAVMLIGMPAMQ